MGNRIINLPKMFDSLFEMKIQNIEEEFRLKNRKVVKGEKGEVFIREDFEQFTVEWINLEFKAD